MDPEVFDDPMSFDPHRYLNCPELPLFTYGLGYRMCAGSLLANRELYLVFMRLLSAFTIELPSGKDVNIDPIGGNADPASLVSMPKRYRVVMRPRDEVQLRRELEFLT